MGVDEAYEHLAARLESEWVVRSDVQKLLHELAGEFDADGRLPVNVDGGLKSFGHPVGASGLRMLYEAWLQLRGEALPLDRGLARPTTEALADEAEAPQPVTTPDAPAEVVEIDPEADTK